MWLRERETQRRTRRFNIINKNNCDDDDDDNDDETLNDHDQDGDDECPDAILNLGPLKLLAFAPVHEFLMSLC